MANYQPLNAIIDVQTAQEARSSSSTFNRIAQEAQDIRRKSFTFREFYKNQLISDAAYSFGDQFLNAERDERKFLVNKDPTACVELFSDVMCNVKSTSAIQYVLTLLSDLTESADAVSVLVRAGGHGKLLKPLLNILFRNDNYCKFQACLVFARVSSCGREIIEGDDLSQYLGWTISQLSSQQEYLECVSRALMTFLKKDTYRQSFYEANGVKPILDILDSRKISFQLQYQLIFCLWMLSYSRDVVERMKEFPVAVVLCDVLRSTNREKVQRVILATFRNLLEKPSAQIADSYAAEMIHFKSVPVLNVLVKQTREDTDMQDDVTFLHEKLNASLQELSSFDEYAAEVKSGRLEWSPVHRSDKFWRENVMKLNENDYEVLRILVTILQESQNPVAIAVAAHDLGEYVRYYPRGKKTIDRLQGKETVMSLVNHGNAEVRMQALLAIQKMMVQNWEYLGKQLESRA